MRELLIKIRSLFEGKGEIDAATKSVADLGAETEKTSKGMKDFGGETKNTVIGVGALAGAVAGLSQQGMQMLQSAVFRVAGKFREWINEGLELNSTLEQTQISVAALLGQFRGNEFGSFNERMRESGKILEMLRHRGKMAEASYRDLVDAYQMTAGSFFSAGINSASQQIDMIVLISQALGALGGDQKQLASELNQILSGNINQFNRTARAINLTNDEVKAAAESNNLFGLVTGRLRGIAEDAAEGLGTMQSQIVFLQENIDQLKQQLAQPIFEPFKDSLSDMNDMLASPEALAGVRITGNVLAELYQNLKNIVDQVDSLLSRAGGLKKFIPIVKELDMVFGKTFATERDAIIADRLSAEIKSMEERLKAATSPGDFEAIGEQLVEFMGEAVEEGAERVAPAVLGRIQGMIREAKEGASKAGSAPYPHKRPASQQGTGVFEGDSIPVATSNSEERSGRLTQPGMASPSLHSSKTPGDIINDALDRAAQGDISAQIERAQVKAESLRKLLSEKLPPQSFFNPETNQFSELTAAEMSMRQIFDLLSRMPASPEALGAFEDLVKTEQDLKKLSEQRADSEKRDAADAIKQKIELEKALEDQRLSALQLAGATEEKIAEERMASETKILQMRKAAEDELAAIQGESDIERQIRDARFNSELNLVKARGRKKEEADTRSQLEKMFDAQRKFDQLSNSEKRQVQKDMQREHGLAPRNEDGSSFTAAQHYAGESPFDILKEKRMPGMPPAAPPAADPNAPLTAASDQLADSSTNIATSAGALEKSASTLAETSSEIGTAAKSIESAAQNLKASLAELRSRISSLENAAS
jgi:hypothetical protein